MGSSLIRVKTVDRVIEFSGFFNDPPASVSTGDNWGFLVRLLISTLTKSSQQRV